MALLPGAATAEYRAWPAKEGKSIKVELSPLDSAATGNDACLSAAEKVAREKAALHIITGILDFNIVLFFG
jgi:hypothetical protein